MDDMDPAFAELLFDPEEEMEIIIDEDIESFFDEEFDFKLSDEIPLLPSSGLDASPSNKSSTSTTECTNSAKKRVFHCSSCHKKFARKTNYDKHVSKCGKLLGGTQDGSQQNFNIDNIEEFLPRYESAILSSLEEISKDDILLLNQEVLTKGNSAANMAKIIVENFVELKSSMKDFMLFMIPSMEHIIAINVDKKVGRDLQCKKLHELHIDTTLLMHWRTFLNTFNELFAEVMISSDSASFLLFHLIKSLFKNFIKEKSKNISTDNNANDDINLCLSANEAKVLRYIAGFIPFSLLKRFRNKNTKIARDAVSVIEQWHLNINEEPSNNFLAFTNSWVNRINRGGLFLVHDEFYIFIKHLEEVARKTFNKKLLKTYKGEDLREKIMIKFEENSLIDASWNCLIRAVEDKNLANILKTAIFRKWIDIRGRSFANSWVQLLRKRHKNAIAKKSDPSLRKKLLIG